LEVQWKISVVPQGLQMAAKIVAKPVKARTRRGINSIIRA
jgi:hypothetical protein